MLSSYTGRVTLAQSMTLYSLTLQGGILDQPAGVDVTIGTGLTWTGGTLNSTTNLQNVYIDPSASATINPGGGTLITGSNLEFRCNTYIGAAGENLPGIVQFNNAAGAVVGGVATATRPAMVVVRGNVDYLGTGRITIKVGGQWRVTKDPEGILPGTWTSSLPVKNMGGVFQVDGGSTANITGRLGEGLASYEQVNDTSRTYIEGGSTLKASHGLYFGAGKLSTLANTAAGGSQVATIYGGVNNAGADVVICDGSSPHVFGILYVDGSVRWTGGTYRPVLDATNSTKADLWRVKDNFEVGGSAKIAPGTINGTPEPNRTWLIMEAVAGAISLLPGATDPEVVSPGVPYTLVKEGNPVKKWSLKSV